MATSIERSGPCPVCGGDDRFSISTRKQVFNCRVCKAGGDVIDLVRFIDGAEFTHAVETLTGEPPPKVNGKEHNPKTSTTRKVAATFFYHDANGALAFVVERIEYQNADGSFVMKEDGKRKKTFRQKRPKPDRPGEWLWNVDGVPPLIYRLPEVMEAIANGHEIIIVEGEAKADLLWSWNVPATCCSQRRREVEGRAFRAVARRRHHHCARQRRARPRSPRCCRPLASGHRSQCARARSAGLGAKGRRDRLGEGGRHGRAVARADRTEAKPWTPSGDGSNMQREITIAALLAGDPFTEDALALRFSERHADNLRYIATKGCWQKWDGARWYEEATHLAFDLARQSCRDDAQTFGNGKPPASVLAAKTIAAVERMAKADRRHATTIEEWDADDRLFNAGD